MHTRFNTDTRISSYHCKGISTFTWLLYRFQKSNILSLKYTIFNKPTSDVMSSAVSRTKHPLNADDITKKHVSYGLKR